MQQDIYKTRGFVIAALIVLGLGLLAARMYQVQILRHDMLYPKARAQYTASTTQQGNRGLIYDIHGGENRNLLAGNLACRDVYAEPNRFKDRLPMVTELLVQRLGIPRAELRDKMAQAFRPQKPQVDIVVDRGVDLRVAEDLANELARLKIGGFRFADSTRRYYPKGSLLANEIGRAHV